MRITRQELAEASADALPIMVLLLILMQFQHHESLRRSAANLMVPVIPFVAIWLVLTPSFGSRRLGLRGALLLAMSVAWGLAIKGVGEGQNLHGSDLLLYGLRSVAVLAVGLVMIVGSHVWARRRKCRIAKVSSYRSDF